MVSPSASSPTTIQASLRTSPSTCTLERSQPPAARRLTFAPRQANLWAVKQYIAKVVDGRLVLDVPSNLPDGTEVVLFPLEEDTLQEEDISGLHDITLRENTIPE